MIRKSGQAHRAEVSNEQNNFCCKYRFGKPKSYFNIKI